MISTVSDAIIVLRNSLIRHNLEILHGQFDPEQGDGLYRAINIVVDELIRLQNIHNKVCQEKT